MHDLIDQVAFITSVARGQGRAHAVLLAEHGADIVGVDICDQVDTVGYPMATPDDLAETVAMVEATGRQIKASVVDVRDHELLSRAANDGYATFGRLDIVLANAGILDYQLKPYAKSRQAWQDSLDILLTGTWNTLQCTVPLDDRSGQRRRHCLDQLRRRPPYCQHQLRRWLRRLHRVKVRHRRPEDRKSVV